MSEDGPPPASDSELSEASFNEIQEKLDQALKDDPSSVDPVLIALTKQHVYLQKSLRYQATVYTDLVQVHIRHEERAILEKMEFAEMIKSFELKLMEGKKMRNRRERLAEIEAVFAERRHQAHLATLDLIKVADSLRASKMGMRIFGGDGVEFPESLRALKLDVPMPKSSSPSESTSSIVSVKKPNPETENLVEPMTDVFEECLSEARRDLKLKNQENVKLKERIAKFEEKEKEWKVAEEKRAKEDAERKEKEKRENEMEKIKKEDPMMRTLYSEIDYLHLHVIKTYSALSTYQRANTRLIDMVAQFEKNASLDRIAAAERIMGMKNKHFDGKLAVQTLEDITDEFDDAIKEADVKMKQTQNYVQELTSNLEKMCLDTFGVSKRVVDSANWKAKRLEEVFVNRPAPFSVEEQLDDQQKELREFRGQLKGLEIEYQRMINPQSISSPAVIINTLVDEVDQLSSIISDNMKNHDEIVKKYKDVETQNLELRTSFIGQMTSMAKQVVEATGVPNQLIESNHVIWFQDIAEKKTALEKFEKDQASAKQNSKKTFELLKEQHFKVRETIANGFEGKIIGVGDEEKDEKKVDLMALKDNYRELKMSIDEMERSIDPSVSQHNHHLSRLYRELQSSYSSLVEKYISTENYANDEIRENAKIIRYLKIQVLEARRGKDKAKKMQEIEEEFKEKLNVAVERHAQGQKIVDRMNKTLEKLCIDAFGELVLSDKTDSWVKENTDSELKSLSTIVEESLLSRVFHKLSFATGVLNTTFEKLINQVKINLKHENSEIRMRKMGYVMEHDEEFNMKNIEDLTKFLSTMETTKQQMADYLGDALKEADENGVDYSMLPKNGDDEDEHEPGKRATKKTPAEILAQTILNNQRTRNMFSMANVPHTGETARRLEQRLFVSNLNLKEREKELAEVRQRLEITENVLKAKTQQQEAKKDQVVNKTSGGGGGGAKNGGPPNRELEKKMAQVFKKKEEKKPTPAPKPTTSFQKKPVLSQKKIDEIRELLVRAIYDSAGGDVTKSSELINRLMSAFTTDAMYHEEAELEARTALEYRVEELEQLIKEKTKKLEETEHAYLEKERQVSILETGFLRRGLGMSRQRLAAGPRVVKNSINQYM